MRYVLLLISLLAVSFAEDVCGVQNDECMSACCESAGGTFSNIADYAQCTGNGGSVAAVYTACVAHNCRPAFLDCTVPDSGCDVQYSTCFDACITRGDGIQACDDACYSQAGGCAAAAISGTSSYCASASLLGLVFVGALYKRK